MVSYRKPTMTKTTAKARIAAAIKKRKENNPVKKSYFRKPVNKNSNYSAISTLSKQVKMLQMEKYGFKQFQHQHMAFSSNTALSSITATQGAPLAFMANNFYEDAQVFYGTRTGTAPNIVPGYGVTGLWKKLHNDLGMSDVYNWNKKQAEDEVSIVNYLPLSTTVKFTFTVASAGPTITPIKVRVTFLKFKTTADVAAIQSKLPTTLGAYSHLVDTDPLTRQYLNTSKFHTIVKEQILYFPQPDINKNEIVKTFSYKHIFDGKTPVVFDRSTEAYQDMRFSVPNSEQIWCVINTDNTDGSRLHVRMERWNMWRDQHGIGS